MNLPAEVKGPDKLGGNSEHEQAAQDEPGGKGE